MNFDLNARSCHTSLIRNNSLWTFGGENAMEKLTNTLREYSINSKQWKNYEMKQYNAVPMERAGHSSIVYNDCMYIFGGNAGPIKGRLNDLWKFDFNKCNQNDAFELINTLGQIPSKRTKHSCVIYKSYMIIYGGWNWDNAFTDLYIIDLNAAPLKWYKVSIKDLPERIWHSCHIFNVNESNDSFELSLIIICGEDKQIFLQNDIFILQCKAKITDNDQNVAVADQKQNGNNASVAENVFQCMINGDNWNVKQIGGVPFKFMPRYGHTSVLLPYSINNNNNVIARDVVVFGGYAGEMTVLNDFWLISIEQNTQNNSCKLNECKCLGLNNLPSPRHGMSLNIFNKNQLIIFGGLNLMMQRFSDITIVNVNVKQWKQMKPPNNKPNNNNNNNNVGAFGMSAIEKQSAKKQLLEMGFDVKKIDDALAVAQSFDHALSILFG